ncbi:hypothetical protein BCR42DRAFT_75918 [Absidia repens]|uniref:Uncharacterized protein n=1 Tax=Absidia repens TaxID=90262 RepID=A0A1X2IAC3_9FUNG|nr:hypothetical protein BCR42DRAFT_75918 [Absidia repens]
MVTFGDSISAPGKSRKRKKTETSFFSGFSNSEDLFIMSFSKPQTCCFSIPLSTGVLIITIFGILNKLSGFYGLISFDFSDPVAFAVYIYSLLAVFVCAYGLYGLHTVKWVIGKRQRADC